MKKKVIFLVFAVLLGSCNSNHKHPTDSEGSMLELSDSAQINTYQEYLGDEIGPVRQNFKEIENIAEWTLVNKMKHPVSRENGVVEYYYLKDSIMKITSIQLGETGKLIQAYYPLNGELSFVLEKEYAYNRPIYWDSVMMIENNDNQVFDINKSEIIEDRSFFVGGKLIRQINNQDCGSPFAEDYLLEEQTRLQNEYWELKKQIIK